MATMKTFVTSTEGLVRLGFLIGIGLVMLSELKSNVATSVHNSSETLINGTFDNFISGISEYGGWVGLIVLIVVGVYFFKNMNFGSKNGG
jgi:putative Mn2+ efflux pump MntP